MQTKNEWYQEEPYMLRKALSDWFDIEAIIAEQARRTKAEVLEEVTDFILDYVKEMGDSQDLEAALLAKFDPMYYTKSNN